MRLTAGLLTLGLVLGTAALGQTTVPPAADPNSAPPDKIGPPLEQHPTTRDGAQTGAAEPPLSRELQHSEGVVHPPSDVDPGMTQTPPNPGAGSTPVIKPPPPGSGVTPQ